MASVTEMIASKQQRLGESREKWLILSIVSHGWHGWHGLNTDSQNRRWRFLFRKFDLNRERETPTPIRVSSVFHPWQKKGREQA
jgi:hypothetical protein